MRLAQNIRLCLVIVLPLALSASALCRPPRILSIPGHGLLGLFLPFLHLQSTTIDHTRCHRRRRRAVPRRPLRWNNTVYRSIALRLRQSPHRDLCSPLLENFMCQMCIIYSYLANILL